MPSVVSSKQSFLDTIPKTNFIYHLPKHNSFSRLNQSLQNLHQPLPYHQLKFPKNKRLRKQTSMQMLVQTQPQKRLTKKLFNQFNNMCSLDGVDIDQANFKKRCKNPGIYHSNSLQTKAAPVQSRSIEDLGIGKNRKNLGAYRINTKNDPILVGEQKDEVNKYLKKIQEEPRRLRDRGETMRKHLKWKKTEPKSYLERFRATRKIK